METGIIKQWHSDRSWGIIYSTGDRRFFLHASKVIAGTPEIFRRVEFEVRPARAPAELLQAINVTVTEEVIQAHRSTAVRP
jgi:cold shock CspA family protein